MTQRITDEVKRVQTRNVNGTTDLSSESLAKLELNEMATWQGDKAHFGSCLEHDAAAEPRQIAHPWSAPYVQT